METDDRTAKLKAEAEALTTRFGLTVAQLQPVTEAVKRVNMMWGRESFVAPEELENVADLLNDAIEDVCLANGIADFMLEPDWEGIYTPRSQVVTHTDCRSEEGVTVGIIDSFITLARLMKGRDLSSAAVQEALADLRADEDVAKILNPKNTEK